MMLEHIWLIKGYAGSGKDVVANIMSSILTSVAVDSFARLVKQHVNEKYDIPLEWMHTQEGKKRTVTIDDQEMTVRDLIIREGQTEKEITGNKGIWAERLVAPTNKRHWVFSDWRFISELESLQKNYPGVSIHTIEVYRPSVVPLSSMTEHELDSYHCEIKLDNSGSLLFLGNQIERRLSAALAYSI
jgi:hypothetical protein